MAQSRPFYMWRVSRICRITGKAEYIMFHDRRPADRLFAVWRKDPITRDNVRMTKMWSAWNRKAICRMLNGEPDKIEVVKERAVFQYAERAWKEHEKLRRFKENW
jgi:hypothetical protein